MGALLFSCVHLLLAVLLVQTSTRPSMAKRNRDRFKASQKLDYYRYSAGNKVHTPIIIRHAPKPMRRLFSSRETSSDFDFTETSNSSPTQSPPTPRSKASSIQNDGVQSPAELRSPKAHPTQGNVTSKALAGVSPSPRKISILALLPYDPKWLFSWPRVREALKIAVDKVQTGASPKLRGVQLVVEYRNSSCSIERGIKEAIDAYMENVVDVFFGPCCDFSAAPVGRQVKYWNLPMITPGGLSSDFAKKDMYALVTRVGPNLNSLVSFMLAVLEEYHWRRVSLIYDPYGQDHILEKFCRFAISALHYGMMSQTTLPHIHQDHFKLEGQVTPEDLRQKLITKIGNRFSMGQQV